LSREAEQKLLRYDWPGNARELTNIVQRAAWLATDGEIGPAALDIGAGVADRGNAAYGLEQSLSSGPGHAHGVVRREPIHSVENEAGLDRDLKERERELILATLRITAGSRKLAAERLGISPRTLRHKLQQLKASGVRVPGLHEQQLAVV
jgi:two-component system response regulator FlrC